MFAPRTTYRAGTVAVCSTLAIATALVAAPPARAQSFNGTGTVVAGSATINTGTGTTDVTVNGNAVINWAPTDTGVGLPPILFQNSGTTATFSSSADFAVLNRIVPVDPTRAIRFDGNVLARVGLSPPAAGGTVYFYSPGGIIASGTSVFDVGNLGLTSSPVAFNAVTGAFDAGDFVSFQPANAGSSVNLQAGSQVTANGYVAIVSPVISNSGTINLTAPLNTGGAAALIAANAVDVTFSPNGLFNIAVTQGTGANGTVLANNGSISGAAAGSPAGNHRVYMVAVPQNQAITMAITSGSTLGFDIADAADVIGNTVVLSAGQDLVNGTVTGVRSSGGGTGAANIAIQSGGINVTSALVADATGTIVASASTGALNFASDLSLTSSVGTLVQANGINSSVNIGRDLTQDSSAVGTAGNASLFAAGGGTVSVGRNALIFASGSGAAATAAGTSGTTGFGGTATVQATGSGSIGFTGRLLLFADGFSNNATVAGSGSGGGVAGTVNLIANTGGSIAVGTTIDLTAEAFTGNGNGCVTCATDGGNSTGGIANLTLNNGTLTTGGNFRIAVRAQAGSGSGAAGGTSTGGLFNGSVTGSTLSVGGTLLIDSTGLGGNHTAGGLGGAGIGGSINFNASGLTAPVVTVNGTGTGGVSALAGGTGGAGSGGVSTINLSNSTLGSIALNSGGFGGNGALRGGNGNGGIARLIGLGALTVNGAIDIFSHGLGGSASGAGSTGGTAQGGTASLSASAGTLTGNGNVTVDASAFGGAGLTAGNATGGTAFAQATSGATLSVLPGSGSFMVAADGTSGAASTIGGREGDSLGGTAQIVASGNGILNLSNFNTQVYSRGIAATGSVAGTDGGNGRGGNASISQGTGGAITIAAPVSVVTDGTGGANSGGGDLIAGTGTGGDSRIAVNDAGGITIGSSTFVTAQGFGGGGIAATGTSSGGAGIGGLANIGAVNGVNRINGAISVLAGATGGGATLNGSGGAATGGQALVGVIPGTTAGQIVFGVGTGSSSIGADATGGNAAGAGAGGQATGGTAQIFATGGNITGIGTLDLFAAGFAGGAVNGLGGNGTGGIASALADNGTLSLADGVSLFAEGGGGSASGTGNGGNATGGTASAIAQNNGTAQFGSDLNLAATADGGNSLAVAGNGGNATGGFAVVRVLSGGDITVAGDATVEASGSGGNGDLNTGAGIGGNGTGGTALIAAGQNDVTDAGGGTITLSSFAQIVSVGLGGDAGLGGVGTGGFANLSAWNGSVSTAATSTLLLDATGNGGFGNAGGDGGDGLGGTAVIFSGNSLNGGSTITLDAVTATANGNGGFGNRGLNPGDAGGFGGNAEGGFVGITAGAGNGDLAMGFLTAQAAAFGGGGGDGGANASGTGGLGGAGGSAIGGRVNVGTRTGTATPGAVGTADFNTLTLVGDASGGAGGLGGSGTTQGNGGAGGDAIGGEAYLVVGGGSVTVSNGTNLSANASGGNGGTGAVAGIGGDANVGLNTANPFDGVAVVVRARAPGSPQRGTLNAGAIVGAANATGGTGSTAGAATGSSPIGFFVTDSDVTAASVDLSTNAGDVLDSATVVRNGNATITGRYGFATAGTIALDLNNGNLTANTVDMFGNDWITSLTPPATPGTLTGTSSLSLSSASDLVSYANLASNSSINLLASGAVQFGNLNTAGSIFTQAQGPITLGSISAGGTVDLLSAGNITTLGATSGGYLNYESLGAVSTGALVSGQSVEVDSLGGGATLGNITAGDFVTLLSNGNAVVGNVTAGIVNPSADPLATYNVGLAAAGNLTVGTVQARNDVGLLADGGTMTSGALTGRDMLLFGTNGVTVNGALSATGRLGIANSTYAALGAPLDDFQKEPVYAALPFAIDQTSAATFGVAGPVTINGPITAQSVRAYTTGAFSSGTISAPGNVVSIAASGNLAVAGTIDAGFLVGISGGAASAGNITARSTAAFFGATGVTTGNVTAGGTVLMSSGGDIVVGNVLSDPATFGLPPSTTNTVRIVSGGSLTAGTVRSSRDIVLSAGQGLNTGALQSASDVLLLAGSGVAVSGPITAPNRFAVARASLFALGGTVANFDPNLVFAALPNGNDPAVPGNFGVAGPVQLGGAIQTAQLRVIATGNIALAGAATSTGILLLNSGANVTTGALTGNPVIVGAGGTATLGAISSRAAVIISSATSVTAGNINAADRVFIASSGNVTTGNIVSDPNPFNTGSLANTIQIGSGGSITTGNMRSLQQVALAAAQDITVGQVNARFAIALLAGGSVTAQNLLSSIVVGPTGQITGASGDILIGNPSMIASSNAGSILNLNYPALLQGTPVAAGGSVTIGNLVAAGRFRSYSVGDFTGASIGAFGSLTVESRGLVTVRRQWFSPDIEIASNDIDIQQAQGTPTQPAPASGLNAGLTGEITLFSTNAAGAFIGDGLTGTGYNLSQAEFGRINSGSLNVAAQDQPGNLIDMTIGNLAITGPQAGSTIDDPQGSVLFATGTRDAAGNGTPSGGIRVTGNISATGFTATNDLEFFADLFELDAGTGSIKVLNASNALSGNIHIEAQHIHIAEQAILQKLEADPLYAGHIADLNRPISVARPDGVFNAAAFDLFPRATLYIQNTGTTFLPAGFLTGPEADVTPEPATGETVEVVINGQFVTPDGVVTGRAAYDALLAAGPDFTGFSRQSQLNSCLFVGGCVIADPVANISSEIEILATGDLSNSPVIEDGPDEANAEEKSEEEKAAEEAVDGAPIAPPAPLIDTRPLNPPVQVTEPVAGSGNPALIGSAVNEATAQGDQQ